MSYASITVAEGLTMADYHAITEQLGPQPAEGLNSEAAGWNEVGLHVITVWDSKAEHDRFVTERLVPAFQAAAVKPGRMTFTDLADVVYVQKGQTAMN
jgi:hypothetical protein